MNGISRQGRICEMSLFNRKETIVLKSEQQKDAYIKGGMLSLSDCLFRKTSPHAELYRGDRSHVIPIRQSWMDLKTKASDSEQKEATILSNASRNNQ
jgi:hypothetical protein